MSGGPLAGIRIVELAGLGALPFGTGKLGDMGADVIRVHRTTEVPSEPKAQGYSEYNRGRLNQNGQFARAAQRHRDRGDDAELVHVYEKIKSNILSSSTTPMPTYATRRRILSTTV